MAGYGSREFLQAPARVEGVTRILCVGDSMIFGQGVAFYETLPFQLENILNRANWSGLFEVINAGLCGHSFYHGWQRLLRLNQHYEPDLILFILCENDAELFGNMDCGLDYDEHINNVWSYDGIALGYLNQGFAGLRQDVADLDVPCLVAYYYIYGEIEPINPAERYRVLCDSVGLDFVDLSAEFSGPHCAKNNPSMIASPSDGHPSAGAHQIAARRLARELRIQGYFQDNHELAEKDLYDQVNQAAGAMCQSGYSPELALQWASRLTALKRSSLVRDKLPDELLLADEGYRAVEEQIAALLQRECFRIFVEGYVHQQLDKTGQFWAQISPLQHAILEWNKKCFVEECNLVAEQSAHSYFNDVAVSELVYQRHHVSVEQHVAEFVAQLNQFKTDTEFLPEYGALYRCSMDVAIAKLMPALNEMSDMSKLVAAMESRMDRLRDRVSAANLLDRFSDVVLGLSAGLADIARQLDRIYERTALPVIPNAGEQRLVREYLMVEVVFVSTEPSRASAALTLQSSAPMGYYIVDYCNLAETDKRQVVRFDLPHFSVGELSIRIPGDTEIFTVESLAVFTGSNNRMSFPLEKEGCTYRTRKIYLNPWQFHQS